MVIISRSLKAIVALKTALTNAYPIKDIREIGTCLGIRVTWNRVLQTLELDQEAYLTGVLIQYRMENCTSLATLIKGYASLAKSTPDKPKTDQN
jgi:hypothetical protein